VLSSPDSRVCCRSEEYVRQYVRLVENERNDDPRRRERHHFHLIRRARASTDDGNVQNVLWTAFDQGIVG